MNFKMADLHVGRNVDVFESMHIIGPHDVLICGCFATNASFRPISFSSLNNNLNLKVHLPEL
jgi:hypothetical protein